MAVTTTKPLKLIHDTNPQTHLWVPVLTTAEIALGSMVMYDATNQYITDEYDAIGDETTMIGVAWGPSATGATNPIPIITQGIFRATLVSATYAWGAGLKYDASEDDGTFVADSDADTIAWFWSMTNGTPSSGSASITAGHIFFDAMLPGLAVGSRLWDIASA